MIKISSNNIPEAELIHFAKTLLNKLHTPCIAKVVIGGEGIRFINIEDSEQFSFQMEITPFNCKAVDVYSEQATDYTNEYQTYFKKYQLV